MAAAQKPVRVTVLAPFMVSHDGTAYRPGDTAEVPEHVAAHWILNEWVNDERSN
jgi:hypothetical protein